MRCSGAGIHASDRVRPGRGAHGLEQTQCAGLEAVALKDAGQLQELAAQLNSIEDG